MGENASKDFNQSLDGTSALKEASRDNPVSISDRVKIDKAIFFPAIALVLSVCTPIVIFPEAGEKVVNSTHHYLTYNFGFFSIWMGLAAFAAALWLSFSKYGNIVFGDPEEKPEYSNFSWISMMFCTGIGAGLMYWGAIEWAYYYIAPPFGLEAGSWSAAEFAATYGIFHWGPIAWSLSALPALPMAYCYYIRKQNVFKISETLRQIFGDKVDGLLGKVVDVVFIFGATGSSAISLGLSTPMIATCISTLTGIPIDTKLKLSILLVVTLIFSVSAYVGIKKGIQVLSNVNVVLMLLIVGFVFVAGPTLFILKMGTTSAGLLIQNFFRMSTWMDPVNNSGFAESWTAFYWAWWIISAPLLGMFIAKISRGRSVRNILMGAVTFCSLGCALMFVTLGNLGLDLQLSGQMDVIGILNESGPSLAIIGMLQTLKFGKVMILLFAAVATVFAATSFDSVSYILATVTSKSLSEDQEPARWNRMFWAFALAIIPTTLILIDGPLSTIQAVSIINVVPGSLIIIGMMVSFIKMVKSDNHI